MRVRIDTIIEHKGNPRGRGHAEATVIYIDPQGKRYEREVSADCENDTKNALGLEIATSALKILTKPCEVDLYIDNAYIASCVKNGWLEEWRQRDWKKANSKEPANLALWKMLYVSLQIHKVRFMEGDRC